MNLNKFKYDYKYWVGLGVAISSLGVSYFLKDNEFYSTLLFIVGISIIIIPLFIFITSKYVIAPVLTFIASKELQINLKSTENISRTEEIYNYAKENGGEIAATHIFQQRIDAKDDKALILNGGAKKKLSFYRIFLFTNKKEEQEWISGFFSMKSDMISLFAYFWKNIDIKINKSFVGLLPRINLLLYKDLDGKVFKSLIGFERVRSRKNEKEKRLNIGFFSTSKIVYDALIEYFNSIIYHPDIYFADSYDVYEEQFIKYQLCNDEQFVIKKVLDYAYSNTNVLHVGAFGGTALILNNIHKSKKKTNHISDLDLLLIVERDSFKTKEDLLEIFRANDIEVNFGDNPDYFYHFRDPKKILVDIEIFERDSNYYQIHQLLGYSIFFYYVNLYMYDNTTIDELIDIPRKPLIQPERNILVLRNKKGIEEFIKKLSDNIDNKIDPRRVLTINVHNINWAITGARPFDVMLSLEFLDRAGVISKDLNLRIQEILGMSVNEINKSYNAIFKETIEILNCLKNSITKV